MKFKIEFVYFLAAFFNNSEYAPYSTEPELNTKATTPQIPAIMPAIADMPPATTLTNVAPLPRVWMLRLDLRVRLVVVIAASF